MTDKQKSKKQQEPEQKDESQADLEVPDKDTEQVKGGGLSHGKPDKGPGLIKGH